MEAELMIQVLTLLFSWVYYFWEWIQTNSRFWLIRLNWLLPEPWINWRMVTFFARSKVFDVDRLLPGAIAGCFTLFTNIAQRLRLFQTWLLYPRKQHIWKEVGTQKNEPARGCPTKATPSRDWEYTNSGILISWNPVTISVRPWTQIRHHP